MLLVLISAGFLCLVGTEESVAFAHACPRAFYLLADQLPSDEGDSLIKIIRKISSSRRRLDSKTLEQLVRLIREYPILQVHVVEWATRIGIRQKLAEAGAGELFNFVDSPSDVEMHPPGRRTSIIDPWDVLGVVILLMLPVVISTDFHLGREVRAGAPSSDLPKEIDEDLVVPKPHEEEPDSDRYEISPHN